MEWQDILTVVETIEKDKNKELHQKEQKAIQKVTLKEIQGQVPLHL